MANLLTLPTEIRIQIYSYLCSKTLELNFCNLSITSLKHPYNSQQTISPSLRCIRYKAEVAQWAREHGLHREWIRNYNQKNTDANIDHIVPAICPRIANEIIPTLEDTVLEFHCYKCLDQLFSHFVHDLGIKDIIIQRLQCQISFDSDFGLDILHPLQSQHTNRLPCGLDKIFRTVGRYYGRYDLLHGDLDALHKQKWYLKKTFDFKKVHPESRRNPEAEAESVWREHEVRDVTGGIVVDDLLVLGFSHGMNRWVRTRDGGVFRREQWWIMGELDRSC